MSPKTNQTRNYLHSFVKPTIARVWVATATMYHFMSHISFVLFVTMCNKWEEKREITNHYAVLFGNSNCFYWYLTRKPARCTLSVAPAKPWPLNEIGIDSSKQISTSACSINSIFRWLDSCSRSFCRSWAQTLRGSANSFGGNKTHVNAAFLSDLKITYQPFQSFICALAPHDKNNSQNYNMRKIKNARKHCSYDVNEFVLVSAVCVGFWSCLSDNRPNNQGTTRLNLFERRLTRILKCLVNELWMVYSWQFRLGYSIGIVKSST